MTTELKPPSTEQQSSWSLHWRGLTLHEHEVTGKHLSILSLIAGSDEWDMLDVSPTLGHQRLGMWLVVMTALAAEQDLGDDLDEVGTALAQAVSMVAEAPATEILGALTIHE